VFLELAAQYESQGSLAAVMKVVRWLYWAQHSPSG
jgi:hypothetical protein